MPLWKIRIRMTDDPTSRALLDQALEGQRVREISLTPQASESAVMAGDVIMEISREDDLGSVLSALHHISPQVFVSRADGDPAAAGQPEAVAAAD